MKTSFLILLLWSFSGVTSLWGATTSLATTLVKTGGIVAGNSYENPSSTITDERNSGIDSQGYSFETRNASSINHSDSTVSTELGGGRKIIDTTATLTTSKREKETESNSGFQYSSDYQFHSSLRMEVNLSTYGRFFFIVGGESTTSLNLDRRLQFIADQPIQISLRLEGSGSGIGLNDIISGVMLLGATHGGPFAFGDILFRLSESDSTINYSGSGAGANFQLTGTNQNNQLDLNIFIDPNDSGNTPDFELRWLTSIDSNISFPLVLRSSTNFGETNLSFSENVSIQAVPEINLPTLILSSLVSLSLHRKRSKQRLAE